MSAPKISPEPIIASEHELKGMSDQVTPSIPEGVLEEDVDVKWSPTHTLKVSCSWPLKYLIFLKRACPYFSRFHWFYPVPILSLLRLLNLLHLHWFCPAPALQCSLASLSQLLFQIQPVPDPAQLTLKPSSHCAILARFDRLRQILKTLNNSYYPRLKSVVFDCWFDMFTNSRLMAVTITSPRRFGTQACSVTSSMTNIKLS